MVYDNGAIVVGDEATVTVTRIAADEANVAYDVPGFVAADLRVRLRAGCLELQPIRVENRWVRPIARVGCPEVAYHAIPDDNAILGIASRWGGLAHPGTVLKGGFYANYGMPTATHDLAYGLSTHHTAQHLSGDLRAGRASRSLRDGRSSSARRPAVTSVAP